MYLQERRNVSILHRESNKQWRRSSDRNDDLSGSLHRWSECRLYLIHPDERILSENRRCRSKALLIVVGSRGNGRR